MSAVELVAQAPSTYLGSDDVIDVEHLAVQALSTRLAGQAPVPVEYARTAFTLDHQHERHGRLFTKSTSPATRCSTH